MCICVSSGAECLDWKLHFKHRRAPNNRPVFAELVAIFVLLVVVRRAASVGRGHAGGSWSLFTGGDGKLCLMEKIQKREREDEQFDGSTRGEK